MKSAHLVLVVLGFSLIISSCKKNEAPLPLPLDEYEIQNVALTDPTTESSFRRQIGATYSDWLLSVEQTPDGGYITVGTTDNLVVSEGMAFIGRDILVVKTNALGETSWTKKFSNDFNDSGMDVIVTSENEYVVLSHTTASAEFPTGTGYASQLLKISDTGEELWRRAYSFDEFASMNSLSQTNDGGFLMVGSESSTNSGIMVRTDANGIEIWRKTFQDQKSFLDLVISDDGSAIVCGKDWSDSAMETDALVMKIDENGDEVWSFLFGQEGTNVATGISATSSGYVMCGYNYDQAISASGFIRSIDDNGTELWYKEYDELNIEYVKHILMTSDGQIAVVGTQFAIGGGSCYIMKVNSTDGEMIWQREISHGAANSLYKIRETMDQGFVAVGGVSGSEYGNGLMIKTDMSGN